MTIGTVKKAGRSCVCKQLLDISICSDQMMMSRMMMMRMRIMMVCARVQNKNSADSPDMME